MDGLLPVVGLAHLHRHNSPVLASLVNLQWVKLWFTNMFYCHVSQKWGKVNFIGIRLPLLFEVKGTHRSSCIFTFSLNCCFPSDEDLEGEPITSLEREPVTSLEDGQATSLEGGPITNLDGGPVASLDFTGKKNNHFLSKPYIYIALYMKTRSPTAKKVGVLWTRLRLAQSVTFMTVTSKK